jgi:16S rRNA (uracil1498-N3)-methyltransferase
MTRRRFYVPRDSIRDGIAYLSSSQAHHLRHVLRLGAGDIVEVFDGQGQGYLGDVEIQGSEVIVRALQPFSSEQTSVRIILAAALIKSAKFEWILQKATELGVHQIVPISTRLSDIRISESKLSLRLQRWERIILEASKQSRRMVAPRLHKPIDFSGLLCSEEFSTSTKLLFYEKASNLWSPGDIPSSGEIMLCIGPEGGWESREVERAQSSGISIFSLGPWTLRAETAAVAALSILQHHLFNVSHQSTEPRA